MHCGSRGCVACTTNAHCGSNDECQVGQCTSNGTCTTVDASPSTSCNGGRGKCGGGRCCTPSCGAGVCGGSDNCGGVCPNRCGSSEMCESDHCVAKPVLKGEYEECTASASAAGNCEPNHNCIA